MAGKMKRKLKGSVKSKTMLGNAAIVATVVGDVLANSGGLIAAIGGPTAVAGVTIFNMVMRALTSEDLADKGY